MALTLPDLARLYLGHQVEITRLRDWLARHQWELDDPARAFVDEVDEALVYLDDGHISQDDLRLWLSTLIERYTFGCAEFVVTPDPAMAVMPASSCTATSSSTISPMESLLIPA